ncbi:MAG: hypothetical protein KDC92_13965 [Bacteroidetes bacterium]|nr:hypothetical protein [Bacteroidota bacterium]
MNNTAQLTFPTALDKHDNEIHIAEAVKGEIYRCKGCDGKMTPVLNTIKKPRHFRHYVKPNSSRPNCPIINNDYRHKLTIDFLVNKKSIKVPRLIIPTEEKGQGILLDKPKLVEVTHAKANWHAYLNEDYDLVVSESPPTGQFYHHVLPDVIFFKGTQPILFIEVWVTHKVDDDKIIKLNNLGVDTVEFKIPPLPAEEIEKSIKTTERKTWIYHHKLAEYEKTNGPIKGIRNRIFEINEEEKSSNSRRFECARVEIKQFIQRLGKLVESKQFVEARNRIERELSETRLLENRIREEFEETRERIHNRVREQIDQRHQNEIRRIELEEKDFRREEKEVQSKYEEFKNQHQRIARELRQRIESIEDEKGTLEFQLQRKSDLFNELVAKVSARSNAIQFSPNELQKEFEARRAEIESSLREYTNTFKRDISEEIERTKTSIQKEREDEIRIKRVIEKPSIAEFEGTRPSYGEYTQEWDALADLITYFNNRSRYKTLQELFDKKAFKNWQ